MIFNNTFEADPCAAVAIQPKRRSRQGLGPKVKSYSTAHKSHGCSRNTMSSLARVLFPRLSGRCPPMSDYTRGSLQWKIMVLLLWRWCGQQTMPKLKKIEIGAPPSCIVPFKFCQASVQEHPSSSKTGATHREKRGKLCLTRTEDVSLTSEVESREEEKLAKEKAHCCSDSGDRDLKFNIEKGSQGF